MRINTSPYSDYEKDLIRIMWPVASHREILDAMPGRTICGIRQKAEGMGIAIAETTERKRRGTLDPLLGDGPEAWYWLGFFLADGHITRQGQFVVMLSDKDEDHLEKLAAFFEDESHSSFFEPEHPLSV